MARRLVSERHRAEIFATGEARFGRRKECMNGYMTDGAKSGTTSGGKRASDGAIAQLGERLLCTQEVGGSIPPGSTNFHGELLLDRRSLQMKGKLFL